MKQTFDEARQELREAVINLVMVFFSPIRLLLDRLNALPYARIVATMLFCGIVIVIVAATILHWLGRLP